MYRRFKGRERVEAQRRRREKEQGYIDSYLDLASYAPNPVAAPLSVFITQSEDQDRRVGQKVDERWGYDLRNYRTSGKNGELEKFTPMSNNEAVFGGIDRSTSLHHQ